MASQPSEGKLRDGGLFLARVGAIEAETEQLAMYQDLAPQSSAPPHKQGRIALADADWDPDADGAAELVISDGVDWYEIVDFGGTL